MSTPTTAVVNRSNPARDRVVVSGSRATPPSELTAARAGRLRRLWRGPTTDPRWARPGLVLLLLGAALLYFWDLSASGYANEFYAAAVKSGTQDLTAWLFGSLDSANAITVDKPPAALWLMVLSSRIFGFSSFAMLLPQALAGVGTVALTHAAVRRVSGPGAGLVAGALVAITPVAALMFRFNNPDALLTLLMTAAGYAVVRAIETTRGRSALRWLVGAGVAIGFAFLTKMMQGLLVLPGFALAYLIGARFGLWTKLGHLLAAFAAMVVGAGWLVVLAALWPAASRPYIGGSTNNSLWELALGYNGLGRIFGGEGNGGGGGGAGGGGGNTGFGGAVGLLRMFNAAFGTEISWFLPAALFLLVAGLVVGLRSRDRGNRARTRLVRASLVLWGGWLLVSVLVLSFMEGTVHPYYAVALAPAIGAVIAIGGHELWCRRASLAARCTLAVAVCLAADWSFYLMHRDAGAWLPWLPWVSAVLATLGAGWFVVAGSGGSGIRPQRGAVAGLLVAIIAAGGGSAAWTLATVAQPHSGSIPVSGPAVAGSRSGMGPGGATALGGGPMGAAPMGGTAPSGTASQGGQPPSGGSATPSSDDSGLVSVLNAAGTRWSAAVVGDQSAAGYILSTDTAVMAIGGWSGSDDAPTLAQFQAYVSSGQIHYFIAGGGMGGGRGGPNGGSDSAATQISTWVSATFTATTVGGVTVYDLTQPATS